MKTYFLIAASDRGIAEPADQFDDLAVVSHPYPTLRQNDRPPSRLCQNPVEKIIFINRSTLSVKSSFVSFSRNLLRKITPTSSQGKRSISLGLSTSGYTRNLQPPSFPFTREGDGTLHKANTVSPADSGCSLDKEDSSNDKTVLSTFFDKHFDEEDPTPGQQTNHASACSRCLHCGFSS